MKTYRINDGWQDSREVEADGFLTRGEFVDFTAYQGGEDVTVLRLRADAIHSIELVK